MLMASNENKFFSETCSATGFQKIGVCVPVTVTPFVQAGPAAVSCCGEAEVFPGEPPFPSGPCQGEQGGSCTFTISQTICISVPVEIGANAQAGEPFVNCREVSAKNICQYCDTEENA